MFTFSWHMREYQHELKEHHKLDVLMQLHLHTNHRARCWPKVETIASNTGMSTATVTAALDWMESHHMLYRVPYELRTGDEEKLPARQTVYQLTGFMVLGDYAIPYYWVGDRPEVLASLEEDLIAIQAASDGAIEILVGEISLAKILAGKTKVYIESKEPTESRSESGNDGDETEGVLVEVKPHVVNTPIYADYKGQKTIGKLQWFHDPFRVTGERNKRFKLVGRDGWVKADHVQKPQSRQRRSVGSYEPSAIPESAYGPDPSELPELHRNVLRYLGYDYAAMTPDRRSLFRKRCDSMLNAGLEPADVGPLYAYISNMAKEMAWDDKGMIFTEKALADRAQDWLAALHRGDSDAEKPLYQVGDKMMTAEEIEEMIARGEL